MPSLPSCKIRVPNAVRTKVAELLPAPDDQLRFYKQLRKNLVKPDASTRSDVIVAPVRCFVLSFNMALPHTLQCPRFTVWWNRDKDDATIRVLEDVDMRMLP